VKETSFFFPIEEVREKMHYATTLILPKEINPNEDIEKIISDILQPYNLDIEVPEYETTCLCSVLRVEGSPAPDCSICKGTGKAKTTINPKGKWDWWVIGGRWHGLWSGKNIEKVEVLLSDLEKADLLSNLPESVTFYYVTPYDEWIGRWEEDKYKVIPKDETQWGKEVKELLTRYKDHIAVLIDIHS